MSPSKISLSLFALLLGALMPLSFAPFNIAVIAPFSLALLLFIIKGRTPKQSFGLGLLFGFGMFAWGIWWVRISLLEFGGAPLPLGIFLTLLLALYLALYYGILTYLMRKIRICPYIKVGILFPVIGVFLEYLRGELFSGFPWLALGYSFTDSPVAHLLFPEMGALMSSFWVYWIAGVLFIVLQNRFGKRSADGTQDVSQNVTHKDQGRQAQAETSKPKLLLQLAPSTIAFLFVGGLVLGTTWLVSDRIERNGEPLSVALIQGNIPQEMKFSEAQYLTILATYFELTETVADRADLIIWPETAIPGLYENEVNVGEHLRTLSRNEETTVMTGIFTGSGSTIRNSIVTYSDQSRLRDQRYDKVHLVPFGEFIPFRSVLNLFSGLIEIPYSDLSPGEEKQEPFRISRKKGDIVEELSASAFICYEAVFGNELRYQGLNSDFLVNVSNDAWFGDSNGPWQHFQITRARAIELQREMVRSTNNGITALIGQNGQVKAMLLQFEVGVLEVDVTPLKGTTSYAKLGDLFWLGVMGILIIISFGLNSWGRKRVMNS